MNKNGLLINQLAFADDIILFSSGEKNSLKFLMDTLATYKVVSGKLINKHKSCVILAPNTPIDDIKRVKGIANMEHKNLPVK